MGSLDSLSHYYSSDTACLAASPDKPPSPRVGALLVRPNQCFQIGYKGPHGELKVHEAQLAVCIVPSRDCRSVLSSGGTNVATFGCSFASSNLQKYCYGFKPVTTPTSRPSISLVVASNCTTAPRVSSQNGD